MLLAFEAVAAESIVAAVERGRVGASSSVLGNNVVSPSTILSGKPSDRFAERLPQTASSEKWSQAGSDRFLQRYGLNDGLVPVVAYDPQRSGASPFEDVT